MSSPLFYIGIGLVIAGFLAWAWVNAIDDMMENHPDYRGEDLLEDYPPAEKRTETGKSAGDGVEKTETGQGVNTQLGARQGPKA